MSLGKKSLGSLNHVVLSLVLPYVKFVSYTKGVRPKSKHVRKRFLEISCTVNRFELRDTSYNGTHTEPCINFRLRNFFHDRLSDRFNSMHAYIPLQFVGSIIL